MMNHLCKIPVQLLNRLCLDLLDMTIYDRNLLNAKASLATFINLRVFISLGKESWRSSNEIRRRHTFVPKITCPLNIYEWTNYYTYLYNFTVYMYSTVLENRNSFKE
jgi:hypothetical protein